MRTVQAHELGGRCESGAHESFGTASLHSGGGIRGRAGTAHVKQTACARDCGPGVQLGDCVCRCPAFGCTTASGAAAPRRNRRPWPERPPSLDAWRATGEGWDVHAHPNPLREVAPGPAVPCGKAKRQAEMGPVSTAVGDAVQPTGQPVGQQARDLLEAALDTFRTDRWLGATPRRSGGDGAVRLHPPRCRLRHAEMGGRSQPRPRSADRHRRSAGRGPTANAPATCMTEAVFGRAAISCPATPKVNRTRRTCHQHPLRRGSDAVVALQVIMVKRHDWPDFARGEENDQSGPR